MKKERLEIRKAWQLECSYVGYAVVTGDKNVTISNRKGKFESIVVIIIIIIIIIIVIIIRVSIQSIF